MGLGRGFRVHISGLLGHGPPKQQKPRSSESANKDMTYTFRPASSPLVKGFNLSYYNRDLK